MPKAFLVVAAVVTLAVLISGEGFAGKICGQVLWKESEPDSGAYGVMVYAKRHELPQGTSVATNCCGKYAFTELEDETYYDVWAVYSYDVFQACSISGSECIDTVTSDTMFDVQTDAIDIDFYMELDCSNAQDPCGTPCP